MNKIITIFKNDIKKLVKSKIAIVILIGLIFIPGIYAWLNIDSNWNPYDNTGDLPIAIVNLDEGYTFVDTKVCMGDMLVESLQGNHDMKWIFTDKDTAINNVNESKYYGAIIIPEDFTSKVATIFDNDKIEKPKCKFYVNEKKNPIAPIIVNKAVGTIQTKLNEAFVNAIVYKVMDQAENMDVVTKTAATTDDLIVNLNNAKKEIRSLKLALNTVALASDSASNILVSLKEMLPSLQNLTNSTIESADSMKKVINSFNLVFENVNDNIGLLAEASKNLSDSVNNILEKINTKENVTDDIELTLEMVNNLTEILTEFNDSLNNFGNAGLQIKGLEELKATTANALKQITDLQEKLQTTLDDIQKNDAITEEVLKDLQTTAKDLNESLTKIQEDYNKNVKPSLNQAMRDSSNAMTNVVNVLTNLNTTLGKSDKALDSLIQALNNTTTLTNNINSILDGLIENIDNTIETLGGAKESEIYLKIVNLLKNTPEAVADFISTPVETEEEDVYAVNDYGSKMAPFYTILASWVGCTLLVSIVKTDVKECKKLGKLKLYQEFFGRFLLFGIVAVLQGFIIALGDIILGVQVINYPLFIFTSMLASLVFMMIIYSLTISFGKVGEAIAVVIMVFQVAGSGGTFPIELLPRLFQIFQPFMPFYPAMNAMREIIGGFYGYEYIINIGLLLCHTIIPLILGVALRKPIKQLKDDMNKKLEETDLIA